ncbi:MAG: hypothetical protein JKY31_00720 [Rhodobacteraceae bacterium]|nr:hypothetical protein [Paracoccaceae bacterium]
MNNGYFNLTTSAFHILKASYGSSRSDIADLVDDAEFDGFFDLAKIHHAQQSLLAPMARLEQELSWLPELSEAQVSGVFDQVKSGNIIELKKSSEHFPELAKANVLAHLCCAGNVTDDLLHSLAEAWDEVDQTNILKVLNEDRERTGFPGIELQHLQDRLKDLEILHARTAAVGIWSLDRPGEAMERIVETELRRHPTSLFLGEFVRYYDNLSEPDLVRVSDEIDTCIERARESDADLGVLVGAISDLLIKWDDINQPVQVYEQHQGHEEGKSKRIYEKLRVLNLELAKNRGEFTAALLLSEALLRTFPELESVAEVLKRDVAQLEELDEQQKQHQHIEPLIAACEAAKNELAGFKSDLARSGFSHASKGPVYDILVAFKAALPEMVDESLAFVIVRDLALYINNDRNDPETAFRLIDGLLSYGGLLRSKELSQKLREEHTVLQRNWKQKELAANAGNTKAMLVAVNDLLNFSEGPERRSLRALKIKLVMKRTNELIKLGVLIAAGLGFVGFLIFSTMDKPNARTPYQPPTPAAAPTQTVALETLPPVGRGLTLNRSQIRYCVFQGQRLDTIRPLTNTNNQIDRFNRLIDDFNSRCSDYRYRSGALSSIQREAREKASELRADARRIVASW